MSAVDLTGWFGIPVANAAQPAVGSHLVHFYEDDAILARAVVSFVQEGLRAGDPLIVIATAAHTRSFWRGLEGLGLDPGRASISGQLTFLDAEEMLATFMRDGAADPRLFQESVGGRLAALASTWGAVRLRAYGEMVDVLWQRGERSAALHLEALWSELQSRQSFTLLCAYSVASFYRQTADYQQICAAHTHFIGEEPSESGVLPSPRLASIAEGAPSSDDAQCLKREIAQREQIESALRATVSELRLKEQALAESERQLRDFVENATVGLHRVGPDGTILWANRAELELLGYDASEYIGRPIREFHVDPEVIEDILDRLGRHEELHNAEARLRAKDGSIKHVVISSSVYASEGRFIHSRCFTRDVTAHKQLESQRTRAAERAERLLRITAAIADAVTPRQVFEALVDHVAAAVEASSAALWLLDADTERALLVRAVGYSESAERAFAAVSLDLQPSFPALDTLRSGEPLWGASRSEVLARYPHLSVTMTPGRSYRVFCLPLGGPGRPLGVLGLTLTATDARHPVEDERAFLLVVARYASQAVERLRLLEMERRSRTESLAARSRAEQAYRFAQVVVSAQRIEAVFDAGLDAISAAVGTERAAILLFDAQGVMRFRAWRNLSDEYRATVEGHSPWSPDTVAPRPVLSPDVQNDALLAPFRELFQRERIGALAFIPLITRGRLLGKFMVYHDEPHAYVDSEIELATAIANHLASTTARFVATAKLEETIVYNELFAGVLAHDLRNPLSAMMTAAQLLLRQGGEGERQTKPLGRILASGERMDRMIDQLLDFTRARSGGGIDIEPRETNLGELCAQAVGELETAYPEWKILRQVSGDPTGSWDPDRLTQIISNLVANAGQHGDAAGGVLVELDGTLPDRVTLRVHNEGTIPEALLPAIFDPFRSTRQRRAQSRGLGLGLFIVREIVSAHGGTVQVVSSEPLGTTFTIYLPRRCTARPPATPNPEPAL
jgi:PAS domain S-box-containing protein